MAAGAEWSCLRMFSNAGRGLAVLNLRVLLSEIYFAVLILCCGFMLIHTVCNAFYEYLPYE